MQPAGQGWRRDVGSDWIRQERREFSRRAGWRYEAEAECAFATAVIRSKMLARQMVTQCPAHKHRIENKYSQSEKFQSHPPAIAPVRETPQRSLPDGIRDGQSADESDLVGENGDQHNTEDRVSRRLFRENDWDSIHSNKIVT